MCNLYVKFKMSVVKQTINPDLDRERKNCTFNVEELAQYWYGDQEKLDEKRAIEEFFLNDPELEDEVPSAYLSHKEMYENAVRKSTIIARKIRQLQKEGKCDENYLTRLRYMTESGIIKEGNPLSLHFSMFVPTIVGQGTPEQHSEWLERAKNMKILGTYAQTELGHGSFIRGLETRATYDEKTEEFVLHSPTLTAYKWWPGSLSHSSNYAVVLAQLYTKGKCHGIHPFIVHLRDDETWNPLPGIKVGEIGPRLSMKTANNGYLGFDHVRIPRRNMLMKNSRVLADGTYVKSPSSILTYGTMVFVRVIIIRGVANQVSKAATIATRYSAVRRQSPIDPKDGEPQVIDHVTQQQKVIPNIASVFVIKMAADYTWNMYSQVTSELKRGNMERLPELHAFSCCLKAVGTADGAKAIEQLRLSCGGHGFMECSNLPTIYGMVTAACRLITSNCTALTENSISLSKSMGKTLVPTLSYLSKFVKQQANLQWDSSITGIVDALQSVAANKLRLAYDHIEERKKIGQTYEQAANATGIELVQCAVSHCRAFLVSSAYEMTKDINKKLSPELSNVINQLVELYAIDACMKSMADLIRFTTISESEIQYLQERLEKLLTLIRPNAVGIVDGFDIPDSILCSAIGAYDGNVYERLYAEAQKSPLNKETDNKAFHSYLKPFLKSNL